MFLSERVKTVSLVAAISLAVVLRTHASDAGEGFEPTFAQPEAVTMKILAG